MLAPYENKFNEDGSPVTTGSRNANLLFAAGLGLAVIIQLFLKEDLRRQRAEESGETNGDENTKGKLNKAFEEDLTSL